MWRLYISNSSERERQQQQQNRYLIDSQSSFSNDLHFVKICINIFFSIVASRKKKHVQCLLEIWREKTKKKSIALSVTLNISVLSQLATVHYFISFYLLYFFALLRLLEKRVIWNWRHELRPTRQIYNYTFVKSHDKKMR